jgi:hypothetical protein
MSLIGLARQVSNSVNGDTRRTPRQEFAAAEEWVADAFPKVAARPQRASLPSASPHLD